MIRHRPYRIPRTPPPWSRLFLGWSVVEGLGAVLVIPAIAALVADDYRGADRVTAFALIGVVSGAAVAAGPLIGGAVTTYFDWRYVFVVFGMLQSKTWGWVLPLSVPQIAGVHRSWMCGCFLISSLRSGLSVPGARYAVIAGLFFMVPVYPQMTLARCSRDRYLPALGLPGAVLDGRHPPLAEDDPAHDRSHRSVDARRQRSGAARLGDQ